MAFSAFCEERLFRGQIVHHLHSTGSKLKSVVTRMYPVLPAVY